jgi:glycosyltransferase involved in cell wall biosynthesis
LGGCHVYRNLIPHKELKKFGVEVTYYPYLPNFPGRDPLHVLVDVISRYDLVIIQRCYIFGIVERIVKAANFCGVGTVFDSDDDYINLPPDNPCYWSLIQPGENPKTEKERDAARERGIERYKEIIGMVDCVTVSTEELKRTLNPYNSNIHVLENNVEQVWEHRDHNPESAFLVDSQDKIDNLKRMGVEAKLGDLRILPNYRLWSIPDYYVDTKKEAVQVPRLGYTGTVTHRGNDFKTVQYYWNKLIERHGETAWFVYIGDKHFWDEHEQFRKEKGLRQRNLYIPQDQYDLYMYNIRNLDVAIAPLMPSVFNMAKSDIKAVEAGAWGIPSVLPNYVTYSRNWKHGENCLLYYNGREFMEAIETLLFDPKLRYELGQNALKYIKEHRREQLHSQKRYDLYKSLVSSSYRLKVFPPKEKECTTALLST